MKREGGNAAGGDPRVLKRVGGLVASAAVFSGSAELGAPPTLLGFLFLGFVGVTATFLNLPMHYRPEKFATPWVPFVPALGILATVQLIASLGPYAWLRFVVYTTLCLIAYVVYGVRRVRVGAVASAAEGTELAAVRRPPESATLLAGSTSSSSSAPPPPGGARA